MSSTKDSIDIEISGAKEGRDAKDGKTLLNGNGVVVTSLIISAFCAGMAFIALVGVGDVPRAPWAQPGISCVNSGVQSPRDLTTGATGQRPTKAVTMTDAQALKLPQTNVRFHLGAEHKSDHYNIGTDSEAYDAGWNSANPTEPPLGVVSHTVRPGWMCPTSPYTSAQLKGGYIWKHCTGDMHIGKSYEVHYVHSTAAPGSDETKVIADGLGNAAGAATGVRNPQIVVEAQIYMILNTNEPIYQYDDLAHGFDLPNLDTSERVMYAGSTTGNNFNNTICSPYVVTWHVDKKCHPVSASSFDNMCRIMKEEYGQFADLTPHGSRILLDSNWVVPSNEVFPLA